MHAHADTNAYAHANAHVHMCVHMCVHAHKLLVATRNIYFNQS